jgi:hypothetical protein
MSNQNLKLKVGDEIGFTILAGGLDYEDRTIFLPVVEVSTVKGERVYKCRFPDGEIQRAGLPHSALAGHAVKIKPQNTAGMIPLKLEKMSEFAEAVKRGADSSLVVYGDWERDTYVVVNKDSLRQYRVNLQTVDSTTHADCDCPDFIYRERICKHIASVLTGCMFRASF